jgi:hypothetical protein
MPVARLLKDAAISTAIVLQKEETEPASMILMATGLLGLVQRRTVRESRHRRRLFQ